MSRRSRIIELLRSSDHPMTTREMSLDLGLGEPTVARDLHHIARTLRSHGEALMMVPPSCVACGFVFDSPRTAAPSKCPRCRSLRIQPPAFAIDTRRQEAGTGKTFQDRPPGGST